MDWVNGSNRTGACSHWLLLEKAAASAVHNMTSNAKSNTSLTGPARNILKHYRKHVADV